MMHRRNFLKSASAASAGLALGSVAWGQAKAPAVPKLTFYGSTQQVSGSCHLLETSKGLFLVDCGLFFNDLPEPNKENREFPFEPKDVKALFLTHGHVDHIGRLPLLYQKGFRGKIYCIDATRDICQIMLDTAGAPQRENDDEKPLYEAEDYEGMLGKLEAIPYNTKIEREGLTFRYTDAGHLLGSAMIEIWVDRRKILFSGDMGPDYMPILCRPAQHFTADAVLVESTYGPAPKDKVSYEEFGKKIMAVIGNGGSVLLPAFALHKTQALIYILHKLAQDKIVDPNIPIYSDSSSAQKATELYNRYREYHDADAKKFGQLFYRNRYREMPVRDTLETHGKEPAIYISTSGMLDHAAAPKHLAKMADDPKNAVFIVGYQAPGSVGKKLESGERRIDIPIEDIEDGKLKREIKSTEIKLQVERVSGFSSHARGEQIMEWLHNFKGVGDVYVVHGDKDRATGLAAAINKMGVHAVAPKRGESFVVGDQRVKPGAVPKLDQSMRIETPIVDK